MKMKGNYRKNERKHEREGDGGGRERGKGGGGDGGGGYYSHGENTLAGIPTSDISISDNSMGNRTITVKDAADHYKRKLNLPVKSR